METDTRRRILDAAQELIQRVGANGMSYQHISEAVGIRKASIHHHFPTKEDLIEALLDRYNREFLGRLDRILAASQPAPWKLARYMGLFEATLKEGAHEKACLCGMLGAELATLGSASVVRIRTFYEENERRLRAILEQGLAEKSLRFPGETAPTAAILFALLEGAVLIARAHEGLRRFRAMSQQMLRLLGAPEEASS